MPKFKLTAPHYLNDAEGNAVYLEVGAIVGDGTPVPFKGRPSLNMVGVDDASQKLVDERLKNALVPVESLPIKMNGGN